MQKRILVSLFTLLSWLQADAQLKLADVFGDHAVLQRDKPLRIWGTAAPNAPVEILFNGQTKTTKAKADGKWAVELRAMDAGGPYTLEVSSKREKINLKDLYMGEVWLCSGQSNMEWPVRAAANANAEIQQANHPLIRHFLVEKDIQLAPQPALPVHKDPTAAGWKPCSPETAGDFTAVGYFFARAVQRELGHDIAIGLIHSSWGGSQAEGWISEEGMAKSEVLGYYAKQIPRNWQQADSLLEQRILRTCVGPNAQKPTAADEARYTEPGYDYSKWPEGSAPGSWDWQEIWAFRGKGYMAHDLVIQPEWADSSAVLLLGQNNAPIEVYINGVLIEKTQQNEVIRINIPPGRLKAGKNSLLLKIGTHNYGGWSEMGLLGDGKMIRLEIEGERIPLDDKEWFVMPAWSEQYRFLHLQNNVGASIYNAMIHPLIEVPIRGVLWYQGESNAVRAHQYRAGFPLLIEDWRRLWNDPFPFLFVQLSSYGSNKSSNSQDSRWPELREAQSQALSLPNTGMVVTIDIGNADDIHPTNKQDVGERLAAQALFSVYDRNVLCYSPRFFDVSWEAASAVLFFDHTDGGLVAKDKFGYVRGFEIAGEDRVFYYAQAQIFNGNQIMVAHPKGQKPVAIRYAWSDAPTDANVFNGAGFPLGTFRTDDWPCITLGKKF